MIVNPTQAGWEIIYHRAHALLAAQIAGQWRRSDVPPRLYETIATISHHDDLEKEWENNNLTEAGAPLDFTLDSNTSYERLSHHVENALYRGRWVALLTSMHLCNLSAGQEKESTEAAEFLKTQQALQQTWRKQIDISQADADRAYAYMQWCDRLSLILCQKKLPEDERWLEVSQGHDGQRYDIKQYNNELITVTPWCFETDRFTVNVEASYLSQLKFENNERLVEALQKAPRQILEWTFVKN